MNPAYNKTGEYPIVVTCIEAMLGYFESAFFMGFTDTNVWHAMASDGVPVDQDTPEDVYKVDSADLVTCIHFLIDHRARLMASMVLLKEALASGDEIGLSRGLMQDVIDAALENRPGPFNGNGPPNER